MNLVFSHNDLNTEDATARSVRQMLQRARKPSKLAEIGTINTLRRFYGIADPVATLRRLVDDTFSDTGESMQRLRELIVRCDIDASTSQKAFAQELHVSYRHFHRIRAEAVAAIAAHLGRVLGIAPETPHALPALGALAEILAEQRPRSAEGVFAVFGAQSALVQMTRLQALVEAGEELDDRAFDSAPAVPRATVYALIAHSKELNGKPLLAQEHIVRLHRHLDETHAPLDDATRAELAWRDFLHAKYRANAIAIESHARSLERLATEHARSVRRAILARATAHMHRGELDAAMASLERFEHYGYQRRDGDGMATALLLRAQLAYMSAEPDRAVAYARAASAAIERPHLVSECAATLLTAELALGNPRSGAIPLSGSNAYGNLQLRLAHARMHIHFGRADVALAEAFAIGCRADELGYEGLASRARATAGAAHRQLGDHDAARAAYLRALALYAPTWSARVAFDLFSAPGTQSEHLAELIAGEEHLALVFERLLVIVPQAGADEEIQRARTHTWLAAVMMRALGRSSAEYLRDATLQLSAANSSLAHYLPKCAADIARLLALMLDPLLPSAERPRIFPAVNAAVNDTIADLRPGATRDYLII